MYATIYSTEIANAIDSAIANELHATDDEYAFAEESVFTHRKTPAEHIKDGDDFQHLLGKNLTIKVCHDEIAKLLFARYYCGMSRTDFCHEVKVWKDAMDIAKAM